MTLLTALFLLLSLPFSASAGDAIPLVVLPDDETRDYWLPQQVNQSGELESFQQVIISSAKPLSSNKTIRIAFIYPSADVSDFWRRSFIAMTKRLTALGIQYEAVEFESKQIQHSLQTEYTQQVIAQKENFDYVVFGPSELSLQAENINALAREPDFETFIWAFHTPLKSLIKQPLMWLDFSSSSGAKVLCNYMLERLGQSIVFAMNRGIPGITDSQRSGEFKQCVESKSDWDMVYEHFGQYRKLGGSDGARSVTEFYPEVSYIHNANTAMTMGALEALQTLPAYKRPLLSGWGGTALEVESIRAGKLNMTPMRMNDDLGVATAEAIRYSLQNRQHELPAIYLGRITIVHDMMSEKEINEIEANAFRYSGVDTD